MTMTNDPVDPELKAIHQAVFDIYNRETMAIKAHPTTVVSIKATNFLAGQATMFADAALILMEDTRQPLNVPAALLRTCLEAQARANHIVGVTGQAREDRASELEQLMKLGHDYYETLVIKLFKDYSADESTFQPRDRPYLPALKATFGKTDTSKLKVLKKQYEEMNRNWAYGKVVERDKFGDPKALSRSEAQPLQPMLNLVYTQCCAFVHSDPASLAHSQLLTRIDVAYNLVLAEVISIMCFSTALGKHRDQDLMNIKKRIMAFDVNEKILPKKTLPSV
jgi:hypothetical protein